MRDDIPFIRSIAASPDDDAPRLIYSDFLEETGTEENVARAEFIRVQVERAQLDPRSRRWKELWRRDTELLSWARTWRSELPGMIGAYYGGFIRGFIDRIEAVNCGHFVANAGEVFDRVPVRKLIFPGALDRELYSLLQERGLKSVCDLAVSVIPPAIESLRALLDLGPWSNLVKLSIRVRHDTDRKHRLILAKLRRQFGRQFVG